MRDATDRLSVVVRDDGARLLVSFKATRDEFQRFLAAFRDRFLPLPRWSPQEHAWILPASERRPLLNWLAARVHPDALTWVDELAGRGRCYSPFPPDDPLVSAYTALHLLPTAPVEVVQAAHRALVKLHHPDLASDEHSAHSAMVTINQAITAIRAAAR